MTNDDNDQSMVTAMTTEVEMTTAMEMMLAAAYDGDDDGDTTTITGGEDDDYDNYDDIDFLCNTLRIDDHVYYGVSINIK